METTHEGTRTEEDGDAHGDGANVLQAAGADGSGAATELNEKARQLDADLLDVVRESTVTRPFAALTVAAGVGFILGALRTVNRSKRGTARDEWRDPD
jgi:hypothetical protein